jgi:hypothetical protein
MATIVGAIKIKCNALAVNLGLRFQIASQQRTISLSSYVDITHEMKRESGLFSCLHDMLAALKTSLTKSATNP